MHKKASFWRWLVTGIFLAILLVSEAAQAASAGPQANLYDVIINEWSQGPSGSKEWVELLVVNGPIDMRGWDLTDGNGSGVVTFSTDSLWTSVPSGTLIVIYNGGDRDTNLPADDIDVSDWILVIPHSNSIYFSGGWPAFNNDTNTDNPHLRDSADITIHNYSTAPGTSPRPGSGKFVYYTGNTSNGVANAASWTVGTYNPDTPTPGIGNNTANSDWIASLRVPPSDIPPTVASTVPPDNAIGVLTNANITITFSENVTVSSGWYTIICTISGGHAATVDSGPKIYTLDPTVDFTAGESCTINIYGDKVTDQDGDPNKMVGIHSWDFTIAVPACTSNLFISEYIEGASFNKAIEIVNMTGATVNLNTGNYKLQIYTNGSASPTHSVDLDGSVAHGDVYVVCHGSANAAILAQCDQIYGFPFNGNDAVVLAANTTTLDVIGQIGFDPGDGWDAGGDLNTKNHTLTRKTYLQIGDDGGNDDFVPELNLEWFGFSQDTSSNLGSHMIQCAESGPRITDTSPAHLATGVATDADLEVTFSEAVNPTGSWFYINCSISGVHTAQVSNVNSVYTLNPEADFMNGDTCEVTIYGAQVSDQDSFDPPDILESDQVWSFSVGTGSAGDCTTIPGIQGSGYTSGCLGAVTGIQGCITGVTATGFYFQDLAGDSNPATSDGIFVYKYSTWENAEGLAAGNQVSVSGTIIEYYNTTEFQSGNTVTVIGSCTVPAAVAISPIANPNDNPMLLYERFEGMRVQMSFSGFVVGATKRFDSRFANGDPEIAFVDSSSSIYGQRVFYDDYLGYQGINYLSGGLNRNLPDVDFGDTIAAANVTGVLGYQFDKYTLLVDSSTAYTVVDDPNDVLNPIPIGNEEFAICTFNAENLFDHISDGDGDVGDWSPADADEYDDMLTKRARAIIDNLRGCTILALEEIEGKDQVWLDLIAKISDLGGPTYGYDYYESVDVRDITVGILYDTSRVTRNFSTQRQSCSATNYNVNYGVAKGTRVVPNPCASGTYPVSSRPPYVANVTVTNATGGQPLELVLIVNHFKSKSGSESVNLPRRILEAEWVLELMSEGEYYDDPTNGSVNIVALGDFNDYLESAPLDVFDNATVGGNPLANLYLAHVPAYDQYSYNFNGESEILDHFIATFELNSYYLHGRPVHINSDFPDLLTITASDNCPGGICTFGATPDDLSNGLRSSDHDPIFARFGFPLTNDFTDLATSYGLARHVAAHTLWLGPNVTDEASAVLNGDNLSDDGVTRPTPWQDGANGGSVSVSVSGAGPGCLHAWIDWNGDGTFDEGTEHIINAGVGGTTTYTFDVPTGSFPGSGANLLFPARFRLYATCPAASETAPYGTSANGEVEDYIFGFFPTALTLEHFSVSQRTTPWAWALLPAILVSAGGLLWLRRRSK